MKLIFLLSKHNLELSKAEVLSIFPGKNQLIDNLLFLDTKKVYFDRLAYTKAVYQHLFICNKKTLERAIKKFDWNKYYEHSFAVRSSGKGHIKDSKIADLVWDYLDKPLVDLVNPKTEFHFFFAKDKIYCGLLLNPLDEPFEDRKAHLRPMLHPTSLHPRLARCLVNLTGAISTQNTVVDPFCGTGGILIEAGLMDFKTIGYDIDDLMLKRADKNLKHFKVKFDLRKKDATKIKIKYNYFVTDLPYARSSKKIDLEKVYSAFLKNLKKVLKKRAVVCFPSFINHKKFIKASKLKLVAEYSYYLHKSLSKTICVLEP
ncbi:methyltransferase domain-containing protein [Candidatus Woesearchaeota archaeon]|nr:methyltransferase domain-containing protein [Candidatus Woesearchaeota archaeon]MBW3005855.1 methyltransferase domain-containing protein [Candidatus Woesearchaeota archaeon]